MIICGIDPGTEKSAFVVIRALGGGNIKVLGSGWEENARVIAMLYEMRGAVVCVEMVASYGMAVGTTTFEAVFWIGRFFEAASRHNIVSRLYRKTDVCMNLCRSMRAKDANIRQALIDRFGEQGTKRNPGVLYGISSHKWAALAVAVTKMDYWGREQDRGDA